MFSILPGFQGSNAKNQKAYWKKIFRKLAFLTLKSVILEKTKEISHEKVTFILVLSFSALKK